MDCGIICGFFIKAFNQIHAVYRQSVLCRCLNVLLRGLKNAVQGSLPAAIFRRFMNSNMVFRAYQSSTAVRLVSRFIQFIVAQLNRFYRFLHKYFSFSYHFKWYQTLIVPQQNILAVVQTVLLAFCGFLTMKLFFDIILLRHGHLLLEIILLVLALPFALIRQSLFEEIIKNSCIYRMLAALFTID